ncbi:unnamed protein product [Periconia digitata]|uniref:Nucleoside phosphorylase domain-containing protein n=1 Tax=Periconia digitata TaxID=1303443 RepID=A0A9W4XRC7_9PLEO|nr:unnamed protein product [Periconia digitata]
MAMRRPAATEYTVGWVCALSIELAAAEILLDEEYEPPPHDEDDLIAYTFGRIGKHNVIITCLPAGQMGIGPAAAGAVRMQSTFKSIRIGLMVGIGGGVPSAQADIRLGDIVVSQPRNQFGGVVQYDYGKTGKDGRTTRIGSLNSPPKNLLNALSKLQARQFQEKQTFQPHLAVFDQKSTFCRESAGPDVLFEAKYDHSGEVTCSNCSSERQVPRKARNPGNMVTAHYGTIASGNQVIKDGPTRDKLSADLGGVLCFDMEAAGLMNEFPCLVVRGICDYADSHKNKSWQPYAAATAAAYAKGLLLLVQAAEGVGNTRTEFNQAVVANNSNVPNYKLPFILKGVPVGKLAHRILDQATIERALLVQDSTQERRIMVLHGLGGMGKTQLAVDFARQNKNKFSAVIWLDGSSEHSLKLSLASCANRIPEGQISEPSRTWTPQSNIDVNTVVGDVLQWLEIPDNDKWLLIVDNVDRNYERREEDPDAYDIEAYLPNADHGSVLITTRLASLGQLDQRLEVKKVDTDQARAIFEVWYGKSIGSQSNDLLALLDGLPLALAQAAAYMAHHGISCETYIRLYGEQWEALGRQSLRNYERGSISTTWMISFAAVKRKSKVAANLLLLWAHLDNGNFWHGLLKPRDHKNNYSEIATRVTSSWVGDITTNESEFINAMGILRTYSLIEDTEDQTGWVMHSVVHQWALHIQDDEQRTALLWIAIVSVGFALPSVVKNDDFWLIRPRLSAHVERCSRVIDMHLTTILENQHPHWQNQDEYPLLWSVWRFGYYYNDINAYGKAKELLNQAVQMSEKEFGPNHTLLGFAASRLGFAHYQNNEVDEAEMRYNQAIHILGQSWRTRGDQIHLMGDLGELYSHTNRFEEAENILQEALLRSEKAFGSQDPTTLRILFYLGILYAEIWKMDDAVEMLNKALSGRIRVYGPENVFTLVVLNRLGDVYRRIGHLDKAEELLQQAIQGFEKSLGPEQFFGNLSALNNIWNIGFLREAQRRWSEARDCYQKAHYGHSMIIGEDHPGTKWLNECFYRMEMMIKSESQEDSRTSMQDEVDVENIATETPTSSRLKGKERNQGSETQMPPAVATETQSKSRKGSHRRNSTAKTRVPEARPPKLFRKGEEVKSSTREDHRAETRREKRSKSGKSDHREAHRKDRYRTSAQESPSELRQMTRRCRDMFH